MKLSTLKKEILLVLLSKSRTAEAGGDVCVIAGEIREKRPSSSKYPPTSAPSFVCVRRSLERLGRDGLVYVDRSQKGSLDFYFLNSRGKRKAQKIEEDIRNYFYKWWKFVKK